LETSHPLEGLGKDEASALLVVVPAVDVAISPPSESHHP
jgi:hypothetical protein